MQSSIKFYLGFDYMSCLVLFLITISEINLLNADIFAFFLNRNARNIIKSSFNVYKTFKGLMISYNLRNTMKVLCAISVVSTALHNSQCTTKNTYATESINQIYEFPVISSDSVWKHFGVPIITMHCFVPLLLLKRYRCEKPFIRFQQGEI